MALRAGILMAAILVLGGCKKEAPPVVQDAVPVMPAAPQGKLVRIVALGDSLLAGYGLRSEEAYPLRLQAALRRRGVNAQVVNAGVSGDTTQDGLERLEFTLSGQNGAGGAPDLVMISLGGNDMLRGTPVARTRANMDAILKALAARHIKVVVLGMLAAPNMGPEYKRDFDAIFPDMAKKHGAILVPFFLKPVFDKPELQLPDHIHPTAKGVEAMVGATLDVVLGAVKAPAR
jgi:acyl-CoA thioesterase-1